MSNSNVMYAVYEYAYPADALTSSEYVYFVTADKGQAEMWAKEANKAQDSEAEFIVQEMSHIPMYCHPNIPFMFTVSISSGEILHEGIAQLLDEEINEISCCGENRIISILAQTYEEAKAKLHNQLEML